VKGFKYIFAAATAVAAAFSSANASQSEAADFYKGKTVQVLIGYGAGGGYDTYGRTLARHLGKHIPGNPTVIVKNVPGAGSLVLMNQIANSLPSDGTLIGVVNSGMPFEPLFGNDKAKFDVSSLNWLGSLASEVTVGVATKKSGISSWDDLKTKKMTVGATGAGSNTNFIPRVLSDTFDLNMQVIPGYTSSNDIILAMSRGEVEGMGSRFMSSLKSSTPQWLEKDSDVNILYQLGGRNKHPDLPNVPKVSDLAKTDKQRQIVNLLSARLVVGRPLVAPPGVPAERHAVLEKAIADTVADPEFLADAKKQSLDIDYMSGQEMKEFFREVYQTPKEVVEQVQKASAG
jgi:tripartite-type tricarboxylate transporter receptor subunit TctC